jgi:multidrug efflux pump subunit AcrB
MQEREQERTAGIGQRMTIGRFSVTHTVLINILMVTILALGVFSLIRLPQEQFAEVPFFWVNVIVPYPGVSAEDMESSVTIPVENQFQGISRLKRISSTTSEGLSVVRVEFDDGISNDEFRTLYQEAQTRFSQVQLPDGILTPIVDDFSSADFLPVIEVVISGDQPYEVLRDEAELLRNQILKVSDVSDVDIIGLPDRQIILDVDTFRLTSLGLTANELLRAVQDQNSTIPGGSFSTESREYLLRTVGSVNSIADFSDVIVRRSADSAGMIRVSDVARVIDGFDRDSPLSRFNGDASVSLRVTKVPRGSSVSVVSGTREIVENARWSLPVGMELTLFNDSTVQIASSLSVLTSNALMGLALLVVILWLFIGFRNAMMTALGIPVTFALTFLVLDLLGETINTNTLFGLVLVLGLIVDHAIVIIENSYRLQQNGLLRADAAILGTDQVVWPVIAATGTTVAAFLPLMIIPGTIGKFLRVIPLTVSIALIVSTGEALFFLPNHFADWGKEQKISHRREAGWWFASFQRRYTVVLRAFYRFKKIVLLFFLLIAIGSFALVGMLDQDLFSAEDYSYFSIDITLPTGTPLTETDRVTAAFEQQLLDRLGDGEIISVSTSIGNLTGDTGATVKSNVAQIVVDLTEQDEGRTRGIDEIIEDIKRDVYYIAGPEQVTFRKAQNGPPTADPLSFRVFGDDYDQIAQASRNIQDILSGYEGLVNIEDDYIAGSPELQVRMNPERASALGVSVSALGGYLRARFEGIPAGTFFLNNEEIDIVLQFDRSQTVRFQDLSQAMIPTDDGRMIPFSSIAEVVQTQSLGSIRRLDGKREVTVTSGAQEGVDLPQINEDVRDLWDSELQFLYPGVDFAVGGEFSEFQDLLVDILRIFLIGVFLIYLILGAQFNSYSQPLLILLSVPFAFVGIILYLAVSGTPFSTTVLYAGVALAGIAVNDAIVLISFINDKRTEGMAVAAAVIEAAHTRIRPILLTSLTTIVGLLPTAIGIGGTSVVWGPMASTIIFGLIFSTLTALFIIPLLYGLIYDRTVRRERTA